MISTIVGLKIYESSGFNPGYNFHRHGDVSTKVGNSLRKNIKTNIHLGGARREGKAHLHSKAKAVNVEYRSKKFEEHTREEHESLAKFHNAEHEKTIGSSQHRAAHKKLAIAHNIAAKSIPETHSTTAELSKSGVDVSKITEAHVKTVFGKSITKNDIHEMMGLDALISARPNTTVKIEKIFSNSVGDTTKVVIRADAYNSAGKTVGSINRRYIKDPNGLTVEHDFFKLDDNAKGKGIGSKVIKAQLESYQKYGGAKVTVIAGLEDGKYVWARVGFNPNHESQNHMLNHVTDYFHSKLSLSEEDSSRLANQYRDKFHKLATLKSDDGKKIGEDILRTGPVWYGSMTVPAKGKPSNDHYDHAIKYLSRNDK